MLMLQSSRPWATPYEFGCDAGDSDSAPSRSTAERTSSLPREPNYHRRCLGVTCVTIYADVITLPRRTSNQLRLLLAIPPERYIEEMGAFQAWMKIAHSKADNPVVVRAQVMTQLYVAFVWLRDSLLRPLAEVVPTTSVTSHLCGFLSSGRRRLLRNSIAHGRWCYLQDFSGLEFWSEPTRGRPIQRYEVSSRELDCWQALSRGTAIAVLLALTRQSRGGAHP